MTQSAHRFYLRAKNKLRNDGDLPDFFVYYLTIERSEAFATTASIRECYAESDLKPPSWLASHLSKGLKSKPRRFVRRDGGYRLEHHRRAEIESLLGYNESPLQTSATLEKLEVRIADGDERDFLRETINCFSAGAFRATVVMCWNLALYHLQEFILADAARLSAFNGALAKNTDTRVKIKSISKQDDFTEMPESKFILFCRESKLITSSVFKKLERYLDERNNAAHPSGVKVTSRFAETYIEDVVENVMIKYT